MLHGVAGVSHAAPAAFVPWSLNAPADAPQGSRATLAAMCGAARDRPAPQLLGREIVTMPWP